MFGDGLVQRFDAEFRVHRVRQPPTQYLARGPTHDRDNLLFEALPCLLVLVTLQQHAVSPTEIH